jgi:hypothetical protein
MSTAAISSGSIYKELQQFFHSRLSDVQQLSQALKSGDLAGAQKAYNALTQLGQSGPFANGEPFRIAQRAQDFSAIGEALKSGDLAGAQHALDTLRATFKNQGGGASSGAASGSTGAEPPVAVIDINIGGISGASSTAGTSAASSAFSSSTASGPEIVINLGNSRGSGPEKVTLDLSNQANGGEQLTVSVAGQKGSNAEQITLNLNQSANEQIVLNLFNPSANATSQSNGVSVVA